MGEEKELKDFDKTWESLQIKNDYIFSKVMRDKEICIALLKKLLKLKITDIAYLEEEKTINIDYAAKSVRLDTTIRLNDGTKKSSSMQPIMIKRKMKMYGNFFGM